MAKIAIHDTCRWKFSQSLIDHWQKKHEVKKELYWNPKLTHWADITFFDWVDNSLIRASNPDDELWKNCGKPQPKDKNIIARCHDIDAWAEHYQRVNWKWVNHLVFVADHIEKLVRSKIDFPKNLKIHNIKHGIDLEKYSYRERKGGNKIAWIGRINHHKCLELALQILIANPSYELHALGSPLADWEEAYVKDFVKRNNLKFFHQDSVPDVNKFLEDKHFILLTSFKEAFSYVVGEAMAKGIKPIIHHFYGAEKIWPKKYLWNRVSEVKKILTEYEYSSQEYRNFIQLYYNQDRMLKEYDKLLWRK